MKTILITGAAGNIGSGLVNVLLNMEQYNIIGVDNLLTGCRRKLPMNHSRFRFYKLNVNSFPEISSIFFSNSIDYVFHFAAVVGVNRTLDNPLLVLNDIEGIKNILSLAKNCGIKRVFYSSSSEVYGEPVTLPQHEETTPLNSRLPYAIVKNLGEAYFRSYHTEHELPYTIFRFFNTYGPNQSEDFVIAKFLNSALEGKPLFINGDGGQTRTFLYIDDNVRTMISCLENDYCINEVLNVGSDQEFTILELAKLILDITGSSSQIEHIPALKEGDMSRRKPDIEKMMRIIGCPLLSVNEGVKRMIETRKARIDDER